MTRKTKKTPKPDTKKAAWLVEFGMLDRQRAMVVVLTTGEKPTSEQLSNAYEVLDGSEFTFDPDFCPDEGTHHVYRQMTDQSAIDSYPRVDLTGQFAEFEAAKPVGPPPEAWYTWRELRHVEGEKEPRLLVPWSDPHQCEFAFDFIYRTPVEAVQGLYDMAGKSRAENFDPGEDPDLSHESDQWILCKMTLEPVRRPK
jgi:hypothetical protein